MTEPNNDPKRRELEKFCERYVAFWAFACILASFFVGWPAILAWVGLAGGMRVFRDVLVGSQSSDRESHSSPRPKCKRRRRP